MVGSGFRAFMRSGLSVFRLIGVRGYGSMGLWGQGAWAYGLGACEVVKLGSSGAVFFMRRVAWRLGI